MLCNPRLSWYIREQPLTEKEVYVLQRYLLGFLECEPDRREGDKDIESNKNEVELILQTAECLEGKIVSFNILPGRQNSLQRVRPGSRMYSQASYLSR